MMSEQLPFFDLDLGIAFKYIENLEQYPVRRRICICGHTVKSHTFSTFTGYTCKIGNINCNCEMPIPVYFASDARPFKRSTHGFGIKHALGLGIATLLMRKGSGTWLVQPFCQVPECKDLDITVACLDETGKVVNQSTSRSAFLCQRHVLELGGSRL